MNGSAIAAVLAFGAFACPLAQAVAVQESVPGGGGRGQMEFTSERGAEEGGQETAGPKTLYVWVEGSDTPPYESWETAAHDIQCALEAAGEGDRVVVEAGVYKNSLYFWTKAVELVGLRGAAETVIEGYGDEGERAVTMTEGSVLEGFTVRNGVAGIGGGILADRGAVVRNVVVEGCAADGNGGGLYLDGGSVAENVTAVDNYGRFGGGIYAAGTSVVARCTVVSNESLGGGGGVWIGDGGRMTECVVESNRVFRNWGWGYADGGGVYAENAEVAECVIAGNTVTGQPSRDFICRGGGAVLSGGAVFRNNTVRGNKADIGGGVYASNGEGRDCLVTGNEAGDGAGVWAGGSARLWNFTVADNAGSGVGVAVRETALFVNGIAWNNAGGDLAADGTAEVRHSCAEPVPEGEGNFAGDPLFAGEGDFHLRADSPCVDAGETQPWMPDATDFDGQPRVQGGDGSDGRDVRVDVGADEAAVDAVGFPDGIGTTWTWRVVPGARLQLQAAADLRDGASWTNLGEPFTATGQTWTQEETFANGPLQFYRLLWLKQCGGATHSAPRGDE